MERERLIRVLEPRLGQAKAVAWSPEGTRLAVVGDGGIVVVTVEGRVVWAERGERSRLWSVAWSPDGRRVAKSAFGGLVVHDAGSGEVLVQAVASLRIDLAWSPDGQRLAAGSADRKAHIHEGHTLRELPAMAGHTGTLWGVGWSPDGQLLASGSDDSSVRVWGAASGQPIFVGTDHKRSVRHVRWSPDGRTLASASHDHTIRLRAAVSYQAVAILTDAGQAFHSLSWTPDSRHLASGALDGLVCLWDVAAARCIARLPGHSNVVYSVAFSPDGTQLASSSDDGTVRLWDTSDLMASTGSFLHLVPSQWALPAPLRHYRAIEGGLLYRASAGREPPRLRPTVLILDVSPTIFGPVEILLRTAAHTIATSLLEAGLPSYLIAAGGRNLLRPLQHRLDLFEVLAARSRAPVDPTRTLRTAMGLRNALPHEGGLEPIILLLTHPWLGAEADDDDGLPAPPHLRALFVPYPGFPGVPPALAALCEQSVVLAPADGHSLGDALAGLFSG